MHVIPGLNQRSGNAMRFSVHKRIQFFFASSQQLLVALFVLFFYRRWRHWDGLRYLPWSGRSADGRRRVHVVYAIQVVLGASPDLVVLVPVVYAHVVFLVFDGVDGHGRPGL